MIAVSPLVKAWVNRSDFQDMLCADYFSKVSKPILCEKKKMFNFQRLCALDGDILRISAA